MEKPNDDTKGELKDIFKEKLKEDLKTQLKNFLKRELQGDLTGILGDGLNDELKNDSNINKNQVQPYSFVFSIVAIIYLQNPITSPQATRPSNHRTRILALAARHHRYACTEEKKQ